MKFPTLLLILITLTSCLPSNPGRQLTTAQNVEEIEDLNYQNFANSPEEQLYWFTHQREEDFARLSLNALSLFFLQGFLVEKFLQKEQNFTASYCLVARFSNFSPERQLRMHAIPIETSSPSNGQRERVFRLTPNNTIDNTQICQGTINGVAPANAIYHPGRLCGSEEEQGQCPIKVLASDLIEIWMIGQGETTEERTTKKINFKLENKGVHIYLNAITGHTPLCSDSTCRAKGLDCCLPDENKCIKDAQLRPDASSQPGFTQAQSQVSQNPARYINWPEVYYICPQGSLPPGQGNKPTPGKVTNFQQLRSNYLCQEGNLSHCEEEQAVIIGKIQLRCGCLEANTCPHMKYEVKKDEETGNIVQIFCRDHNAPPPEVEDRTVSLSTRSVPHRFFRNSDGKAVDDFLSLKGGVEEQEGSMFFYLDQQGKTGAQSGQFNINSILGSMSLILDQSRPALMVPVEFDQIYILGATGGSYRPCPLCPKDQWFDQLTAHPTIIGVDGLIAVGHTTRRDEFEQNITTTNGNFEDTKFGRACWLPPTMIPFSHKAENDGKIQRQNRLETQSAFYINGYQRDWFGFNKGAVIGSFDGATWFAIGNGRRVRATGNKLYLAINTPFADLATHNNILVSIGQDINVLGESPDYDFDPSLKDSKDARYNQSASCQSYHQCEVDADCITQLGWEYQCADISQWKTLLPSFDLEGNEQINRQIVSTPNSMLVGGLAPKAGTKRCVYRGMGALCQQDPSSLNESTQKLFTCAPNFYCASLGSSRFNHQLVRDPSSLTKILYGLEADVLGRPERYLGANSSLPDAVQANIKENFKEAFKLSGTPGICVPGKDIAENTHLKQHQAADATYPPRTDYIGQIGSCNSTIESDDPRDRTERVWACPLFDDEGNYIFIPDETIFMSYRDDFLTQNSCGNSSQNDSGDNAFAVVEGQELSSPKNSLTRKTLAQHACMRRANSPCFTDLDCTPSRLHAEIASSLGVEYFGNTQGEKQYWEQFLVCGQKDPKPIFGIPEFKTYDMTENRCCRPVGQHLTVPIQRDLISSKGVKDDLSRPIANRLPAAGRNQSRRSSRFMAVYKEMLPGDAPAPYQHYRSVNSTNKNECDKDGNKSGCRDGEYEDVTGPNQWKAPHLMASRTCCGGGWVRKFANGSHDWNRNAPNTFDPNIFDVDNFRCLNYRNEFIFNKPASVSHRNYLADINKTCREASNTGCPQVNFIESGIFAPQTVPLINHAKEALPFGGLASRGSDEATKRLFVHANYATINTAITNRFAGEDLQLLRENQMGIFTPAGLRPTDSKSNIFWLDPPAEPSDGSDGSAEKSNERWIEYHLPSYINLLDETDSLKNNLISVGVNYSPGEDADGNPKSAPESFSDFILYHNPGQSIGVFLKQVGDTGTDGLVDPDDDTDTGLPNGTQFRIRVTYDPDGHLLRLSCQPCDALDFSHAWPVLEFIPQGTSDYRREKGKETVRELAGLGDLDNDGNQDNVYPFINDVSAYGMVPGSDLYYLTKLGRLELLGIPQIHYAPLYCNSNMNDLVPGLYTRYTTRADIEMKSDSDDDESIVDHTVQAGDDNPNHFVLSKDEINLNDVFSENEIICCAPLGSSVTNSERCCTNHSRVVKGQRQCALPPKIDLMVYFNRFVSGEARFHPEQEPDGLTDEDFDFKTGEPKRQQEVYDKIQILGQKYCDNDEENKTVNGAAIGNYLAEPIPVGGLLADNVLKENDPNVRRYGIVDSTRDFGKSDNNEAKGYNKFSEGFRWNHHLYCNCNLEADGSCPK